MRLTQFTTNESRRATNAVMLTEAKILNEWSSVGKMLVEYKLSPEQIQQIFKAAEQGQTGMGGNRTMLGQGKDQVAAVNKAWEDLKSQMQNSAPVKGFDQKVNAALNKIGMGSADPEFQNNVSGWVQKYRDFAKQHPIAQGAIYAVLIALTGLSGAGIAGAAALGLLKMADRVLQGDRFTSALYKGAKTGGTAYALGQLKNHFADQPTGQVVQSPNPSEQFNDYTVAKGDTLSQIAKDNGVSVDALMKSNPEITNPDVIKAGQAIKIPLGDEFVTGNPYQGGVGTASDTIKKIASGEYSPSEISTNAAAKAAGNAASQAADTATDTATNFANQADNVDVSNLTQYSDHPGNPEDWANGKNPPPDWVKDTSTGKYAPEEMPSGAIPADKAPMYDAGADKYDDGASQLGQNPDMTKVADTNQGRLKMNQWRQDMGSPNAKPITPDTPSDGSYSQTAPIGANGQPMRQVPMDNVSDTAASASSNTPTLSLSDTGNGIKGDLTLPDGSTVPAQAFPADGMQPRMPFGSQKVTVELNGQKVDAWVFNGKAYIKDFDTNTLNAPAPSASTGSQFFDRMNRAAANGVRLRESVRGSRFTLTEGELRAVFKLAHYSAIKRKAINEGIWDSIKGAAGKAVDWAQTKGHNLTTKITADKLNSAWQQAGKQPDSKTVRDFLVAQGVEAKVADDAIKSVANVRGKSTQDRRAAAQGTQASFKQPKQSKAQQQAPATQQPQVQQPDELGRIEPTMDEPPTDNSKQVDNTFKPGLPIDQQPDWVKNYKPDFGAYGKTATTKTSQVPANWGGQQQAQPQGTSYEVGSKKAAPQQQASNFASRGIAGMDAAPQAQQQQAQPGFLQSKIKKGGYTYQPEMTEEMISKALAKELGDFMGKKSADKRDISKRPKDREVQKKANK